MTIRLNVKLYEMLRVLRRIKKGLAKYFNFGSFLEVFVCLFESLLLQSRIIETSQCKQNGKARVIVFTSLFLGLNSVKQVEPMM